MQSPPNKKCLFDCALSVEHEQISNTHPTQLSSSFKYQPSSVSNNNTASNFKQQQCGTTSSDKQNCSTTSLHPTNNISIPLNTTTPFSYQNHHNTTNTSKTKHVKQHNLQTSSHHSSNINNNSTMASLANGQHMHHEPDAASTHTVHTSRSVRQNNKNKTLLLTSLPLSTNNNRQTNVGILAVSTTSEY